MGGLRWPCLAAEAGKGEGKSLTHCVYTFSMQLVIRYPQHYIAPQECCFDSECQYSWTVTSQHAWDSPGGGMVRTKPSIILPSAPACTNNTHDCKHLIRILYTHTHMNPPPPTYTHTHTHTQHLICCWSLLVSDANKKS